MKLLVPLWCQPFLTKKSTLPHAVDTSKLKHFHGVKIPVISERKCVDILIGQSDKALIGTTDARVACAFVFTRPFSN